MATSRPSVAELAAQLQETLDAALAENERLTARIKEFESHAEAAERRAQAAERRAEEVQQKLQILETLKTKQYQTVVTELFEGPSRRAARLTLLVAIASILIGLAQTLMSSIYSSRTNADAIVQFSRSLRTQLRQDIADNTRQTKEDLNSIVRDMSRDGSSEVAAIVAKDAVPIQGAVNLDGYRFYQFTVPPSAATLRVTLSSQSGGHAHVYARHQRIPPNVPDPGKARHTVDECLNGHVGEFDQCTVNRPTPGLWHLTVRGFSSSSSNFTLVATTAIPAGSSSQKSPAKPTGKSRSGV